MHRPSESVLTLLPQRASVMLFFPSSATEWQLNLIGPSNFLLKQCTCVCTDALVNICVRACTIETICSQWASMSHRPDLSHGIWGIHYPLCTSPFMHHSFFPFTFYPPRAPSTHFESQSFVFITASPFGSLSPLSRQINFPLLYSVSLIISFIT